MYPPFLKQVKQNINKYFPEYSKLSVIDTEDYDLYEKVNEATLQKLKSFKKEFEIFFREQCGGSILMPYIYPFSQSPERHQSLVLKGDFDIPILGSYFRKDDWDHIVLKSEKDSLERAESVKDHWITWQSEFECVHELD